MGTLPVIAVIGAAVASTMKMTPVIPIAFCFRPPRAGAACASTFCSRVLTAHALLPARSMTRP